MVSVNDKPMEYSGFQVKAMIKGFFWIGKLGRYFLGVA